jgi:hypothetical protein
MCNAIPSKTEREGSIANSYRTKLNLYAIAVMLEVDTDSVKARLLVLIYLGKHNINVIIHWYESGYQHSIHINDNQV